MTRYFVRETCDRWHHPRFTVFTLAPDGTATAFHALTLRTALAHLRDRLTRRGWEEVEDPQKGAITWPPAAA